MRKSMYKALVFAFQAFGLMSVAYLLLYKDSVFYTTLGYGKSNKVNFMTHAGPNLPGFKSDPRECVQKARRQLVTDSCLSMKMPPSVRPDLYPYGRILVDSSHKIAYCGMPKVGTSTYMGLLINASSWYQSDPEIQEDLKKHPAKAHSPQILHLAGIKKLHEFNKTQIRHILKTYTKFIVVRHPIERLLSAYLDKMVREREEGGKYKSHVTFEAFAAMLLNAGGRDKNKMATHNEHWMEYSTLCAPCFVHYDYIIQMETVQEDMPYILQRLFHDSTMKVPKINAVPKSEHRLTLLEKLDGEVLNALLARYQVDMTMYGYSWDKRPTRKEDPACYNASYPV